MADSKAPYGFCPECGQPGTIRARDMIGTTGCANKHTWIPTKSLGFVIFLAFLSGANAVVLGSNRDEAIRARAKDYRDAFEAGLK